MRWIGVVVFSAASLCACTPSTDAGEGEGEGDDGTVTDASVVATLCARIDECSAQSAADCEVAFRNQLISLRNEGRDVCDDAADTMRDGFACAAEQSCEIAVGGASAWEPMCPDVADGLRLIDTCRGIASEGEGEEQPLPCPAAASFDLPGGEPVLTIDSLDGVFDDAVPPECAEFFGRDAGALVTLHVTGDATLVEGGMFSVDADPSDGQSAFALVAFTAVDASTLTAFACLDELTPVELAAQIYTPAGASNVACGAIE